jgi:hypothetical protein
MTEARPEAIDRIPSAPPLSAHRAHRGGTRYVLRRARRRVPAVLWIVGLVVVSLYAVYLLGANVFLRTGLLRKVLNASPDKLYVDYTSAWSPYPGRILARGFSLRFQDDNVQMLIELERASMSIGLFDLTKKTFKLERLEAEGTVFRIRHKLATSEGQEGRLEAYPPIPGFADPAVRPPPPESEIPEESYDLWTIDLDDVSASVREVWVMEYRYRGAGSLAGGMRLRPLRNLEVRPSVFLAHGGTLSLGARDLLAGSDAKLEARVDSFDVRIPKGAEVLRQVTARAEMNGRVLDLAPISQTYLRDMPLELAGGGGQLTIHARVDRGIVHPDTRLEWAAEGLRARWETKGVDLRTTMNFVGRVEPSGDADAGSPSLVAELRADEARLVKGETTLLSLADSKVTVATANDDLTAPFPLSSARLDVPRARASALGPLASTFLPPDVRVTRGSATLALRASYRDHAIDARGDVAMDDVAVAVGEVEVRTAAKAKVLATSRDVRTGIGFKGSLVTFDSTSFRVKESRAEGLTGEVELSECLVRTQGARRSVDTTIDAKVVPGDQVLRFGASLASLPKALGEAPAGPDARARVRLVASEEGVDVRILSARDGDLSARGRIRKTSGAAPRGALLFEVGALRAGVELSNGETTVRPFAPPDWLDRAR